MYSWLPLNIKRTDDQRWRTIGPDRRTRPTNELTNQIKRQNKVTPRRYLDPNLDPYWPVKIPKITTSTESKINLILDKPSDWIQWFFIIQDTAKTNEVWQYIDPSKKKDKLPKLEPPHRPVPADVLPNATKIAQLDQIKLTAYNQLYAEYKDDLRIYEKQKQAINGISNYIVRSTSVAYLPLIDGLDTVHERLQALKTALAPTTSGRKHDVLIQYTALKAYDTTQSIDKWLNNWRNVYKLAEQLKIPDVQGFRPHYDFIRAIKPISSSFAGALEVDLIRKERKDEAALSIIDLIEEFKEHYRMQQAAPTTTANHSAFATLQNNSPVSLIKTCLCGEEHLFRDCQYLIKSLRPHGWVPDEKIQQQIDEKLIRYERLAIAVEKAQKEASQRMPTTATNDENIWYLISSLNTVSWEAEDTSLNTVSWEAGEDNSLNTVSWEAGEDTFSNIVSWEAREDISFEYSSISRDIKLGRYIFDNHQTLNPFLLYPCFLV